MPATPDIISPPPAVTPCRHIAHYALLTPRRRISIFCTRHVRHDSRLFLSLPHYAAIFSLLMPLRCRRY